MKILLFIDSNIKTIPYEVPLLELQKIGHEIIFLSILEKGPIHKEYEQENIEVFSIGEKRITIKRIARYISFFINFCRKQKIDVVFAHLSIPSLIGVLSQYFIKSKVICFRHHFNFINLVDSNQYKVNNVDKIIDKINSRLASKIILPSKYLKVLIQKNEGVPMNKMRIIPYTYKWNIILQKSKKRPVFCDENSPLMLLMISRLTKLKRPELAIDVVAALQKNYLKSKLTIVGVGDMADELKAYVISTGVEQFVHFVGFQKDVVPFINNSDFLIHPSVTEASSSVIKEAGVLGCPVIVCNGVGDFNDYIINEINGWLVNPNNFIEETTNILMTTNHQKRNQIGVELRNTILEKFSITESVIKSYVSLIS